MSSGPADDPDPGALAPWPVPGTAARGRSGRRRTGDRRDASGGGQAATYLLLFLLGAMQSVVGAFFYAGPLPAAALWFDGLIFASCVFGGWGTRSAAGGLAPAAGWLVATFVLANATSGGSILITDNSAGKWFLFGGAGAAAAGVVTAACVWSRGSAGVLRGRPGRGSRR